MHSVPENKDPDNENGDSSVNVSGIMLIYGS